MSNPEKATLDPVVIFARISEIEEQRNIALNRCIAMAGVNASLLRELDAAKKVIAAVEAEKSAMEEQIRLIVPADMQIGNDGASSSIN